MKLWPLLLLALFVAGCIHLQPQLQGGPAGPAPPNNSQLPVNVTPPVISAGTVFTYAELVGVNVNGLNLNITSPQLHFNIGNESIVVKIKNDEFIPFFIADNGQCAFSYFLVKDNSGRQLNLTMPSETCFLKSPYRILATHEVIFELWNGYYYDGSRTVMAAPGEYAIILPRTVVREVAEGEQNTLNRLPENEYTSIELTVRLYSERG